MKLTDFAPYTLLHSIASSIYASAGTKCETFAIMSAFHIIGSAAQLAWQAPHGISPSLFQIFVAPAAYGKDHYRKCILEYIGKIDDALVGKKPGSVQGFTSELISWNTLSLVIDEYDQWMDKLLKNPGTAEIKDLLLNLYNGQAELASVQLKRTFTPKVIRPRISVAGFCTTKGMAQILTNNNISGGLISRVLIWPERKIDLKTFSLPTDLMISPFDIEWLKKIYMPDGDKLQKTKDKNFKDYIDAEQKRQVYMHDSIYPLQHKVDITADAKQYLNFLLHHGAQKFNTESEFLEEKDADNTGIPGRHTIMVERLSCILALSRDFREQPCINNEDVRIADTIMDEHNKGIQLLLSQRHNSEYHKKINHVESFFNKRPDSIITFHSLRHVFSGVELHQRHKMLLSLYEDDKIYILQDGAIVNDDEIKYGKIPRSCVFQLRND